MLLELNESVLSVLLKADIVIASPGHPSQADFPTMVTIMYMLRRGNRMETLTAVKQLTMLCCGAESYVDTATKVVIKPSAMKEMWAAGALQNILSALTRCADLDWPEVEMLICRVVSVLVTHEEDWALLIKHAFEILTALQVLITKVPHLAVRSEQVCDVDALVAASLAKLSLVLCAEWGKATIPLSIFASTTGATEVDRAREVLRATSNRGVNRSVKQVVDPSITLETVLSIIITMCENALLTSGTRNYSDDASNPSDSNISAIDGLVRCLPLLSNSAAVLCSIALCNLAEVPQCVAALVQGGALKLLKAWLELGTDLMNGVWDALRREREKEMEPIKDKVEQDENLSIFRLLRSKEYVQAFELITNAASAVNYLVGGSDILGDKSQSTSDYTAGFIYAQVMGEGLPLALVRLVSASVFDFTISVARDRNTKSSSNAQPGGRKFNIDNDRDNAELFHLMRMLTVPAAIAAAKEKEKEKEKASIDRPPMTHILPRAAAVHLAQALSQLSSRVQSRAHLQGIGAPFALLRLFVSATFRSTGIGRLGKYPPATVSKSEESPHLSSLNERRRGSNTSALIYWDENDREVHDDDEDDNRDNPNMINNTLSNDEEMRHDYFANAILSWSLDKQCCKLPKGTDGKKSPKQPAGDFLANHDITYLKAMTTSCLDALTNFLADDLAMRLRMRAHSSDVPVTFRPSSPPHFFSSKSPLTEVMSHTSVVDSLKLAVSLLPQGQARLAVLRTVASLTDWPLVLEAMIEQGIITELVIISQTRSRTHAATQSQTSSSTRVVHGDSPQIVTPRPSKRGVSFVSFFQGGSPRGSIASATSTHSNSSTTSSDRPNDRSNNNLSIQKPSSLNRQTSSDAEQMTDYDQYSSGRQCSISEDQSPINDIINRSIIIHSSCEAKCSGGTNMNNLQGDLHTSSSSPHVPRRGSCEAEPVFGPELVTEETMCLCFSLANAATSSRTCALALFNSGLMTIMLRLGTSPNLEIVRQALKCASAMCIVRVAQASLGQSSDQRLADLKAKQYQTEMYSKALHVFTIALSNPSSLVQLEAVRGIANIAAVDEQMCDQAVAGSLRTIISMLLDATCDRDTRSASEDVLKAVGFIGGMRDLEVCQFDVELLGEWFTIKKSMPPQLLARKLVTHWIEDLFNGAQPVPVVINSNTANNALNIPTTPVPLLQWPASAPSSAPNSRSGSPVLGRSQNFWNTGGSGNSSAGSNTNIRQGTGIKSEKTLLQTAKSELQRRFTDSISKFVPFCMGGSAAARVIREEEEEDQEMREIGLDLRSPLASSNTSNPYGLYEGMDCPPDGVFNLMDIFYPSHLQQVLLMDMVSFLSDPALESLICWNRPDYYEDDNIDDCNLCDSENEQEVDNDAVLFKTQQGLRHIGPKGDFDRTSARLSLPIPFSLNALLLPMRCYVSFTRVGRVIERIVEQGGDLQPFSLVFRDSYFDGDSHASLLSTLRRCGRIVTLSFANYKNVEIERDSRMGWIVGNLPPSIRFVSLRNILSTESIQTLCILLRKQNLSFLEAPQSFPWNYNPLPVDPSNKLNSGVTNSIAKNLERNIQNDVTAALLPGRSCAPLGLQGLAITHSTFTQADIKYLCDLLEPVVIANKKSSHTPRSSGDKERDDNKDNKNSKSSSTQSHPRGLRYLDLGFNRMGCTNCSDILRAAARGDIESLDLAGNFTQRGGPILRAVLETLVAMPVNNQSSGKSDGDEISSDGEDSDGGLSPNGSSGVGHGKTANNFKSNCPFRSRSNDALTLRLPRHPVSLSTCHLKHLVSTMLKYLITSQHNCLFQEHRNIK